MSLHELLLDFTSGDDQRADAAALRLAALGTEALDVIRYLLASPQVDARWWAARSLAEIPGEETCTLLLQALKDPDASVRHCAALGLCKQPHQRAVPALVDAMASKDALLARLAANALACTGADAVPALLEVLEKGEQALRLEAARALAFIGDERSIPALFKALDEESSLLEYWANEALERMGVGMTFFKP